MNLQNALSNLAHSRPNLTFDDFSGDYRAFRAAQGENTKRLADFQSMFSELAALNLSNADIELHLPERLTWNAGKLTYCADLSYAREVRTVCAQVVASVLRHRFTLSARTRGITNTSAYVTQLARKKFGPRISREYFS